MITRDQMQSVLKKVANHFGLKAQIGKTVEELVELTHEVVKANKGEENLPCIIEEIADVENMLDQLKILYGIEDEVREIRWQKMVRTCNVSRIYDPNWDSEIKKIITAEEQ